MWEEKGKEQLEGRDGEEKRARDEPKWELEWKPADSRNGDERPTNRTCQSARLLGDDERVCVCVSCLVCPFPVSCHQKKQTPLQACKAPGTGEAGGRGRGARSRKGLVIRDKRQKQSTLTLVGLCFSVCSTVSQKRGHSSFHQAGSCRAMASSICSQGGAPGESKAGNSLSFFLVTGLPPASCSSKAQGKETWPHFPDATGASNA